MKIHFFNIVHFDIKPENIGFSSYYRTTVLLDFGMS